MNAIDRVSDNNIEAAPLASDQAIVDYYTEAGADYEAWSTRWNMHFGFPNRPADVLDRERMLDNMNDAVLDRVLAGPRLAGVPVTVADLGCGLGATMRRGARRHHDVAFEGYTIVDWQIERAREFNRCEPDPRRLVVRKADYLSLPLADQSLDGAYALEAACYAPGASKDALIAEAARVLKPGARLVVADGFRTDGGRPFSRVGRWLYRVLCASWAIEELADADEFAEALRRRGFDGVEVEDFSWRVAWSVMWVPLVTLQFLWSRRGELVDGWRAANVVGSLMTMVLGLMRWRFSYLVITARRATPAQRAR